MKPEDAFLLEILENRDDDAPRRVFADWLLDHPDPVLAARGELIHVQCDLARLAPGPWPAEAVRRERDLLDAHAHEWSAPFRAVGCLCTEYRRGFVEGVGLPARALAARADELFRAGPVREVKLYEAAGRLREVAALPALAGVETLDLEKNALGDADLEALAASPHLRELTTLLLWSNAVGAGGLRALTRATCLRLARLDLSHNSLGDAGARALADWPRFARLALVDLSANQIGDAGARALAASPFAGEGAYLEMTKNPITPAGQAALRERFGARVHVWG
jgi:uncharacterized protein (TIGR02996 family)